MSRPPKRTQFKIDNNYIDKNECKMCNYLNDVERISKKRYNADYVAMIAKIIYKIFSSHRTSVVSKHAIRKND